MYTSVTFDTTRGPSRINTKIMFLGQILSLINTSCEQDQSNWLGDTKLNQKCFYS